MRGSKTILVSGILMIVLATFEIFWGFWNLVFAEFYVGVLNFFRYEQDKVLMYIGLSVIMIDGIIQLVTGIIGINMYRKLQKKNGLILLSILIIIISIADFVLSMINWSMFGIVILRTMTAVSLAIVMIIGATLSNNELSRRKRTL